MLVHDKELTELFELLHNPIWPYAIQKNFNYGDDNRYLRLVVQENLDNLKILNVTHKFDRLREPLSLYDTKNWDILSELSGKYDIAFLYDVIDHIKIDPEVLLSKIRNSLNDNGVIYMRCHPWTSRDSLHLSHKLNKAYMHLIFTESELKTLFPDLVYTRRFSIPLLNYGHIIEKSGFRIISRYARLEPPEEFFFSESVFNRIMLNNTFTTHGTFDWFNNTKHQMSIQFVDYILAKS